MFSLHVLKEGGHCLRPCKHAKEERGAAAASLWCEHHPCCEDEVICAVCKDMNLVRCAETEQVCAVFNKNSSQDRALASIGIMCFLRIS